MAANEKATTETIVAQMSEILGKIDKLAHNSTPQDVAAAIGMIGDVEKAMRKIRGKWLQAIVTNAAQGGLPLRQDGLREAPKGLPGRQQGLSPGPVHIKQRYWSGLSDSQINT